MKNTKNQTIYLAVGYNNNIIIRGLDLSKGQAKIYGEEYCGTLDRVKEIDGKTALALTILENIRIVDIDADCVI